MDVTKKRERLSEALGEVKAIRKSAELTGGALTAEQRAKAAELLAETESLKADIAQADGDAKLFKGIDNLETELNQSLGRKSQPNELEGGKRYDSEGRLTGFFEPTDEEINLRIGESKDAVSRQSYKQLRRENLRQMKSLGYQPWGEFKSLREFVGEGLANGRTDAFRSKVERHHKKLAIQGMNEAAGADGGYTVMPEFSTRILDRVYSNPLWGGTDNYTVSGNNMMFLANAETSRATGSRHGGLTGYWIGEGGTITKSKPTMREVSLKLLKLGVVVYLTDELMADSGFALEQYVARKAAEEFNFMIGDALVNGTGAGQPLGMLNAPSLVSVAKETSQGAATIYAENVVKMYSRFFAPNVGNAVWLHNQDITSQLDLMTLAIGSAGVATFMPPNGLSDAPFGTLRGRPLRPTEFNPTLGTQGDLLLADLGQILSISKGGIAQAVSMHVEFLSDQTALRFIMRLNARPWENAPITPYKGSSNTQSNFVTLDTRS